MTLHSILGGSIAKRWINCPGSVRANLGKQSPTSVYAAEGTAAHDLAERVLKSKGKKTAHYFLDVEILAKGWAVPFVVDEEMADAVQVYVDYIHDLLEPGDTLAIECPLDLSAIHPAAFGTSDAVIYKKKEEKLIVADYKHGKGVIVSPEKNAQGIFYAIGAAAKFGNKPIRAIEIVVVQPRAREDEPIRSWECTVEDLMEYTITFQDAAKATDDPNAPLVAGDWCQFCPSAGDCPALSNRSLQLAKATFSQPNDEIVVPDASELSPQEMAKVLQSADIIEIWLTAVRNNAFKTLERGGEVPGFKLVEKRPTKRWTDEAAVEDLLTKYGVPITRFMNPMSLKSPPQVFKALGKKLPPELSSLLQYVASVSSGVTIAPVSDKREAVTMLSSEGLTVITDETVEP